MNRIGITSTVPIEVLLAAGYQPVDLNNIFIGDPQPERLVRIAERRGFPLNSCTWIKGIYGVVREQQTGTVLGITSGDCSNTLMLLEVLSLHGVQTIPFAYPSAPNTAEMAQELAALAMHFGTSIEAAEKVREELQPCRQLLAELDRLSWQENRVSGFENHYWLVSASDFNGNPQRFCAELQDALKTIQKRPPYPPDMLRVAFCGVPAVYGKELYAFLEEKGARVIFNEVQRQFAMTTPSTDLAAQYTNYTYPYATDTRLADIDTECAKRRVDGVIHYVQAFCHRAIGDIVFRSRLSLPVLTIEGNADFGLTQHLKTRLEAFLDILAQIKLKSQTRK
ncbi:MAG: 2-hydroxyacyl-CoA dehydratase [Dehalococcoidia bacterium]|nr:2-hydroxyacyl-CoA dehydratase [Dehalococcoidia bacterium]